MTLILTASSFSGERLVKGLRALLAAQMGQQIGDAETGIHDVLADGDLDGGAVLLRHDAVERQRDGGPLILADAAVIMGFEVGQAVFLKKRHGL